MAKLSGNTLMILLGLLLSCFCLCSMAAQKLYVGNLSWTSTDDTLRMAFGEYGQVLDATVMRDFLTGISKGYGYVTFVNGEEAQAAIDGLNNQELDGRRIKVAMA